MPRRAGPAGHPAPAWSGGVAERGPGPGPARAQAGGQVDGRALLVVADAEAVLEGADPPHVRELSAQETRVHAHRDRGGVTGWWRAPEPEVVAAAVGRREPVGRPEALDRARLAVVAGEQRGAGAQRR